jgi:adenine phosphoribosyltransferase
MKEFVRTILDYPVKGIQFRDITTLLQNAGHFKQVVDEMTEPWRDTPIDAVLSIESRGFIMAGAIAYNIDAAFIPLRKPDKLPGETFKVSYTLEYGSTEMHIHKDALDNHKNLLIIDDLLATGGTALAAVDLIEMFDNKNIVGAGFIINLPDLNGDKKLQERGIKIHSLMDF